MTGMEGTIRNVKITWNWVPLVQEELDYGTLARILGFLEVPKGTPLIPLLLNIQKPEGERTSEVHCTCACRRELEIRQDLSLSLHLKKLTVF